MDLLLLLSRRPTRAGQQSSSPPFGDRIDVYVILTEWSITGAFAAEEPRPRTPFGSACTVSRFGQISHCDYSYDEVAMNSHQGQRVWVKLGDKPRFCPRCRSAATQRSHRRGALEALLTFVPVRPFRCMDCDRRFYGLLFNLHSIHSQSPIAHGSHVGPRLTP
jgi:hypothetical protein